MAAAKGKTSKVGRKRRKKIPANLDEYQPGMPARDSITSVETVKKGGKPFHIIHTTEVDEYEQPPPRPPRKKITKK